MQYEIIKSGSSGNAILLENGLLLDCGAPYKLIEPHIKNIKAVFISHEHHDHLNISTLKKIHELRPSVRFVVGFWLKRYLVLAGIDPSKIDIVEHNRVYDYGAWKLMPLVLVHDVKNYGLKIIDMRRREKIIYAVDTNCINHISAVNYDLYLIEGNYDEDKLEANIKADKERGVYSYGMRVKDTHLSIQKASEWLMQNIGGGTYEFIHQSKNNL
jgi:phosphoribosyl 1,2-cyclic phosphodiesterase